jgi:hypothetical protein
MAKQKVLNMATKTKTRYQFDPGRSRLIIINNDKPIGGFIGSNAERHFRELLDTGAEITIGVSDMNKKAKVRRLRALWITQGIDQYRDAILGRYGVTSTADLTEDQLDVLIREFSQDRSQEVPREIREWRSNVLKLLQQIGVYDNTGNWQRVNDYMMQPRIAGKLMYQMNAKELKDVSLRLRAIIKKNESKNNLSNLN